MKVKLEEEEEEEVDQEEEEEEEEAEEEEEVGGGGGMGGINTVLCLAAYSAAVVHVYNIPGLYLLFCSAETAKLWGISSASRFLIDLLRNCIGLAGLRAVEKQKPFCISHHGTRVH